MEIHVGLEALPADGVRGAVVTWGVFDGVHRGHQKVLDSLVRLARERSVPSVAITFDRHPAEVLRGRDVPLVTTISQRLRLIAERGVNHLLLLNFTQDFARITAGEFLREIVVRRIGARLVLLGHDSQFGRGREGNLQMLQNLGTELGLEVRWTEPEVIGDRPLSSSLIREHISAGQLEETERLLGRPFAISGTVVRGQGRGTKIGFPTANLLLHHRVYPPEGVYVVEATAWGRTCPGVANLGRRPTFESAGEPVLEVHLLEPLDRDLHGEEMEVRFLSRLREEKRFSAVDELTRQIASDVQEARRRFAERGGRDSV